MNYVDLLGLDPAAVLDTAKQIAADPGTQEAARQLVPAAAAGGGAAAGTAAAVGTSVLPVAGIVVVCIVLAVGTLVGVERAIAGYDARE